MLREMPSFSIKSSRPSRTAGTFQFKGILKRPILLLTYCCHRLLIDFYQELIKRREILMKNRKTKGSKEKIIVRNSNKPLFQCSSCKNASRFYKQGLANVRLWFEIDRGNWIDGETEVLGLVGNAKIICGECGHGVSKGLS